MLLAMPERLAGSTQATWLAASCTWRSVAVASVPQSATVSACSGAGVVEHARHAFRVSAGLELRAAGDHPQAGCFLCEEPSGHRLAGGDGVRELRQ